MDTLWDLPEQQQLDLCQRVSDDLAMHDQEIATPPEPQAHYTYLVYQQKLDYVVHVWKGCHEHSRVQKVESTCCSKDRRQANDPFLMKTLT